MKISDQSISILKNFGQFCQGIVFDEPSHIKATSTVSGVIAVYDTDVDEKFPDCAVYDVNKLLSIISVIPDADVIFNDENITITKGKSKIVYNYANAEHIVNPPKAAEKYKAFDDFSAKFELSKDEVAQVIRAAKTMQCDIMEVEISDGVGKITLFSKESSNTYVMDISGEGDAKIKIPTENLYLYAGGYTFEMATDGRIIKATHESIPLFYILIAAAVN